MLRFMKNKILIPVLILSALAAFFSFANGNDGTTSDQRKELILQTVMKAIQQNHLQPRELNDSFSSTIFNKTLTSLDYEKHFFTQEDVDQLKKYQYKLDEGDGTEMVHFFDDMNAAFNKRIDQVEGFYKAILDKPFSFNGNDAIVVDEDKEAFAANDAALKDRWVKYLKYRTLVKYVDLKDAQKKRQEAKDTTLKEIKTDAQLEVDARQAIRKSIEYYFKRWHKLGEDDRFTIFVNDITNSEDPHTDYFPPDDKKRFDEQMSGTFFGIGAQLKDDDGKIKIVAILPGTPCWKQGDLKAGDEILKIAQGAAEPVDIQGYDINDVIKMIKGPEGTEVRLTVRHVTGVTQVIPIVRGKVEQEEIFAKSAIINTKSGSVGYIYLPEFYSDFQNINGRRCAEDVALEVMKLKKSGVNGIILDLRNNTGGSLNDVVKMSGLFIDQGPIVQVKSADAAAIPLNDQQAGTLYDGPMAIMVNYGSASASEIMAAAMHDYKRAVIVGSTTYGKGTVQKVMSLDEYRGWLASLMGKTVNYDTIGSLKLTIQKFYRVNGGSTQLKGVTPDVILPDPYAEIEIGERKDKAALKWDEIAPANYRVVPNPVHSQELAALSKKRVDTNPAFSLVKENATRIKEAEDKSSYSLNEAVYHKELDEATAIGKKMEEIEKKATPLDVVNIKDDLAKINIDSLSIRKNNDWLKNLKKDFYLAETVNIVNDMMKYNMKVDARTGMK
ncbi:MAG: carboxy terminal-processing peptidase [Flavipsychrobacter sp.]